MITHPTLIERSLTPLLKGKEERCGFIIDDKIVEVKNISSDPDNAFDVSGKDILQYAGQAQAIWHTHPQASARLSMADYMGFRQWPKLKHIVVGTDGLKVYEVAGNGLVIDITKEK